MRAGDHVTPFYDPMIAKLITWGEDRATAIERMRAALDGTAIEGVRTNIGFLLETLQSDAFTRATMTTRFVEAWQQRRASA